MAKNVIVSPKYSLQIRDFLKGALIAVIASVAPLIQATIDSGELTFNWKAIGITALGTFVAYIVKNFLLEPAKVTTTYDQNSKALDVAKEITNAKQA